MNGTTISTTALEVAALAAVAMVTAVLADLPPEVYYLTAADVEPFTIEERWTPAPCIYTEAETVTSAEPTEEEIMLAKLVYGEARGQSVTEQAAVMWVALNRVDAGRGTIAEVITAPHQFAGYKASNPVRQEHTDLARDVLARWRNGGEGRVIPADYLYFHGDGKHNYFKKGWKDRVYWDWSLPSPYEAE